MFDAEQVQITPVEIVVYGSKAYKRYAVGKKSIEEEYRQSSVSKRRRKKSQAKRKRDG